MDSRDSHAPPGLQSQFLSHQHNHQVHHHQLQPNMMLGHSSAYNNSAAHHSIPMINPNMSSAGSGFPFNSVAPPRQQARPPSSDGVFDGSPPSSSGMRFGVDSAKKKRGRPRKYTPDGNIALGLSSTPISSSGNSLVVVDSGSGTPGVASEPAIKKNRGRPPGSGKKQLDALGGLGGVGFTPHVIQVNPGEDVASKIMEFSGQGPRTICILSANGAIFNVTLRKPSTAGGTVTYEGRFEIISLTGSFPGSDKNGGQNITGGLSISLAGSDGGIVGGRVAGVLLAATPVQIIVGSFIADGKKSNSSATKSGPSPAPTSQMLNFGAPLTSSSPQGGSSESSDENGSSPLNQIPGVYNNNNNAANNQGLHHGMNMYQLWTQNQH